ncbi:hypothetical protein MA16_Dca004605 [Dendrobium catenatum]|uniref:Uncharacterized protein n=1 Tax=Dendrobium catenatum TaxID=906689 RepID=A0A2I0VNK6_9ASPA|nr:hypothetical protein MA16_Dca004605 [Dendrobium catenatum]
MVGVGKRSFEAWSSAVDFGLSSTVGEEDGRRCRDGEDRKLVREEGGRGRAEGFGWSYRR